MAVGCLKPVELDLFLLIIGRMLGELADGAEFDLALSKYRVDRFEEVVAKFGCG